MVLKYDFGPRHVGAGIHATESTGPVRSYGPELTGPHRTRTAKISKIKTTRLRGKHGPFRGLNGAWILGSGVFGNF